MSTLYSPKIVTDGLVLCLDAANKKSNAGSSTTLTNRALSNTTASIINGSGSSGVVSLDGTNDWIGVNNSETNATLSPDVATFSIWCRPVNWSGSSSSYKSSLISRGNYNQAGGFFIHLNKSNGNPAVYATFSYSTTTSYTYNTSVDSLLNGWGNWVNVTVTVDNNIKVYVDGVLQSTTSRNVSTIIYGTGEIGSGGDTNLAFCSTLSYAPTLDQGESGTWRPYVGDFGNGLMYNRVLTASEILQNFNATKSRFGL